MHPSFFNPSQPLPLYSGAEHPVRLVWLWPDHFCLANEKLLFIMEIGAYLTLTRMLDITTVNLFYLFYDHWSYCKLDSKH